MKSDARWMRILAVRVLANAIVGGLCFAFVGALCLGLAGGIMGTAFDWAATSIRIAVSGHGFEGAIVGIKAGAFSGIIGAIIFIIATLRAKPGALLKPSSVFMGRVVTGQILGTVAVFTFFMAFELVKTLVIGQGLARNMLGDLVWILFGAPTLMICGAIAGALFKRDSPQSATLKRT